MLLLFLVLAFNNPQTLRAIQGIIWSKRDENFVPLFSYSNFLSVKDDYSRKIRELENHNFQRKDVTIAYYEQRSIVSFSDNDTKISGICADLWNILSDYLNFTLIPIKLADKKFGTRLENGSYDGLLGLLDQNKSLVIPRSGTYEKHLQLLDYTMPLWTIRYYLYIKPEWKHDESWMFHLFSIKLWCAYFLVLFVLCIIGFVCEKYSAEKNISVRNRNNLQDNLLYTISLATAQGSLPPDFQQKSRVIYITTAMFSWLILIAFSSHAIFLMMNKKNALPFTDLQSLMYKSTYQVAAFRGSMVHDRFDGMVSRYFRNTRDFSRVSYASSFYELYKETCYSETRKLAAFEAEDLHKANGRYFCRLVPTLHPYFETWVASAIKRGFKYKRSFDNGILKLAEMGLLDGLKDRWLNWKLTEIEDVPFQSIDISQVYMIFCILYLGVVASIFILLIEYATFFRYRIFRGCTRQSKLQIGKSKTVTNSEKKIVFMLK